MQPQPTPRPHVWRTGFLIGIILATISGISVYAWQQIMLKDAQAETQKAQDTIADLESDKAELEANLVRTQTEKTEFQKLATQTKSFTYKNLVYDFEVTLPHEFEGYWTTEEPHEIQGAKRIRFYSDASGTTWPNEAFDSFVLEVYPKGWWAQNAEVDEYEQAYIQGVDQTYETFLGTFIGASDNYVITGHIATQSCPNIDNANKTDTQKADMLCELPNIAKDTVFPTFQSLNE